MTPSTRTSVLPPRITSFAQSWQQLEGSSRSVVFARDGSRLLRAWGPAERPFVLAVEPDHGRWVVEVWGTDVGPRAARAAAARLFSFHHRLEEFYRRVRVDPVLRGTERRFRGLRLPQDPNLFEALFHAILGQQLSVAAANAVKRRLIERTRSVLVAGRVEVPSVPPPTAIRALGVDGLRAAGASGAKARALEALAGNAPSLEARRVAWSRGRREEALAALERLDGVGRWTAENALLRGIGRTDVFVAGDLGIRVALDRYGAVPRRASDAQARAWADSHYVGWGSYATLYLWRKLVTERAGGAG